MLSAQNTYAMLQLDSWVGTTRWWKHHDKHRETETNLERARTKAVSRLLPAVTAPDRDMTRVSLALAVAQREGREQSSRSSTYRSACISKAH